MPWSEGAGNADQVSLSDKTVLTMLLLNMGLQSTHWRGMVVKHWSQVEYLHKTVSNPNIHIRGIRSYYSNAWTGSFEESVVRYLYGDEYSRSAWEPQWPIDQLHIGDCVCIGAE
ncbi:MAG TPA: hypothetical protein VM577_02330, partial [Anaerovoracaceae bacterium]|nr:hypothetical protein [Anaerovoracaceae bacterium]